MLALRRANYPRDFKSAAEPFPRISLRMNFAAAMKRAQPSNEFVRREIRRLRSTGIVES